MHTAWQSFYQTPQLNRWLAAIPRRFSCRRFSGPADLSQMSAMAYAAQRVCMKGIRIALADDGEDQLVIPLPLFPKFEGFAQYAAVFAQADLGTPRLHAGISLQALALEAAALGLQGCIMTGNYRRDFVRPLQKPGEELIAVMPFGVPLDPEGARHRSRKPLASFCPDDPAKWPLWAYKAAEAVRAAPSSLNRQPWKMSFAGNTLALAAKKMDSIDTGIAVMHMECGAGNMEHAWRYAKDRKSLLMQAGEDTLEPV